MGLKPVHQFSLKFFKPELISWNIQIWLTKALVLPN